MFFNIHILFDQRSMTVSSSQRGRPPENNLAIEMLWAITASLYGAASQALDSAVCIVFGRERQWHGVRDGVVMIQRSLLLSSYVRNLTDFGIRRAVKSKGGRRRGARLA